MALQAAGQEVPTDSGHESIPVANRKSTIYGVTITLQILATIAVGLRLYSRIKLFKKPWWDDAAIAVAFGAVSVGSVFILISIPYGLGQHVLDLKSTQEFEQYLRRFYGANGSYMLATTFIKLSLLLQYLRVYETGTMRRICLFLVGLISLWGLAYNFMAWLPCFPVRAFWDWSITDATCYGFGAKLKGPFIAAYVSHAAANLIFDLAVLTCVLPMFRRNDRSKRELVALFGLMFVGTWIIVVSAWRLGTIISHGAGWGGPHGEAMDFTWYAPISILLSATEIATAIFAASMPIFWPIIEAKWLGVFVTQEVVITAQHRDGTHGLELERSSSHGSERSLNRAPGARTADYYRSEHVQRQVDPFKHQVDVSITQSGHTRRVSSQTKGNRYEALDIEYK